MADDPYDLKQKLAAAMVGASDPSAAAVQMIPGMNPDNTASSSSTEGLLGATEPQVQPGQPAGVMPATPTTTVPGMAPPGYGGTGNEEAARRAAAGFYDDPSVTPVQSTAGSASGAASAAGGGTAAGGTDLTAARQQLSSVMQAYQYYENVATRASQEPGAYADPTSTYAQAQSALATLNAQASHLNGILAGH